MSKEVHYSKVPKAVPCEDQDLEVRIAKPQDDKSKNRYDRPSFWDEVFVNQ